MIEINGSVRENKRLSILFLGYFNDFGTHRSIGNKEYKSGDPISTPLVHFRKMHPLVETGVMSLCVAVPIFLIRKKKWVSSATSRKLLHICSSQLMLLRIVMAPIFILCWHLFPSNDDGKYLAALSA